jgi:hypothetical protein
MKDQRLVKHIFKMPLITCNKDFIEDLLFALKNKVAT